MKKEEKVFKLTAEELSKVILDVASEVLNNLKVELVEDKEYEEVDIFELEGENLKRFEEKNDCAVVYDDNCECGVCVSPVKDSHSGSVIGVSLSTSHIDEDVYADEFTSIITDKEDIEKLYNKIKKVYEELNK